MTSTFTGIPTNYLYYTHFKKHVHVSLLFRILFPVGFQSIVIEQSSLCYTASPWILQARILEQVAVPFSTGFSQPEPLGKPSQSRSLLIIYFKYSSVWMSVPNSEQSYIQMKCRGITVRVKPIPLTLFKGKITETFKCSLCGK